MILSQAELEAIRARADAATPGPWDVAPLEDDGYPSGWRIKGPEYDSPIRHPARRGGRASWHDAAFIAHAREDVPALLAEVEELRAKLVNERRLAAAAYKAQRAAHRDEVELAGHLGMESAVAVAVEQEAALRAELAAAYYQGDADCRALAMCNDMLNDEWQQKEELRGLARELARIANDMEWSLDEYCEWGCSSCGASRYDGHIAGCYVMDTLAKAAAAGLLS